MTVRKSQPSLLDGAHVWRERVATVEKELAQLERALERGQSAIDDAASRVAANAPGAQAELTQHRKQVADLQEQHDAKRFVVAAARRELHKAQTAEREKADAAQAKRV